MALIRSNKSGGSGLNLITLSAALAGATWVEVGDIPSDADVVHIMPAVGSVHFIWERSAPTTMKVIGFTASSGQYSQPATYSQSDSISAIATIVTGTCGGSSLLALKIENGKLYQAYNYTNTAVFGYDIFY